MNPGTWSAADERAPVWPGRSWPLGSSWTEECTNFAVHAPRADGMWLCLFDEHGEETRHRLTEQSLGIWHGAIPGLMPGQRYGFRAEGPWDPEQGLRFNPAKLLLDPYARAVSGEFVTHPAVFDHQVDDSLHSERDVPMVRDDRDSAPYVGRSVVVHDEYDWGEDRPARKRWRDTVIYELHVKGFTALHDRIPEELRGTYAGLGHPVVTDYLRDLGVTAVELLPVHQFLSEPHLAALGLTNYWGYNSVGFFAPHAAVAPQPEVADGVAVLVVPLHPRRRELPDAVAVAGDVPRLGDQLGVPQHRVLADRGEQVAAHVDLVTGAGQRGHQVEPEAVDVHLGHPVAQ